MQKQQYRNSYAAVTVYQIMTRDVTRPMDSKEHAKRLLLDADYLDNPQIVMDLASMSYVDI